MNGIEFAFLTVNVYGSTGGDLRVVVVCQNGIRTSFLKSFEWKSQSGQNV